MNEYFRGWKRKAGLVTLAMACVFAFDWIASFGRTHEDVFIPYVEVHEWIETNRGVIEYWNFQYTAGESLEYRNVKLWTIPYWSIVIPLSLLSAWQLLSKPRATTQPTSTSA